MADDPTDAVHDIFNDLWDTNIITKPTLTKRPTGKIRKSHSANIIYLFPYRGGKQTPKVFTYNIYYRVPILIVGLTLANVQALEEGAKDAIFEYLDDAGRTYQYIAYEGEEITQTKPRVEYRIRATVHMDSHGRSMAT